MTENEAPGKGQLDCCPDWTDVNGKCLLCGGHTEQPIRSRPETPPRKE